MRDCIMLAVYIVITLLTALLGWWFIITRKYSSLETVPGPKPIPFIGNTLELGGTPQAILKTFMRYCKEHGDIFKVHVGMEPRVVLIRPELIDFFLSSTVHITKSSAYDLVKPWLGDGLLVSDGPKWKSRRKMTTPTFHFNILEQFIEIFNSCGDILISCLDKAVSKNSQIDIFLPINLCTLDIICETSMGVKINAQENQDMEYVVAVKGFLDIFFVRMFSVWQRFDTLFQFSPKYKTHLKHIATMHGFTNKIIEKRRRELSQRKVSSVSVDDTGIKRKTALLDMLLESESSNQLSTEDLREEIETFMFEGHDTTTSGISFAVLALAENQKVQKLVLEEIHSVIGPGQNDKITMKNLQDMTYLDRVIKEAQRIYPSVPLIERKMKMDCEIGGHVIPKDTIITIFIYGMHHSSAIFPDPEKFDPDRFLPENQSKRHNYAYVPFSAGPRNCIGQKFAVLEMKTTLIKIVRNFKILPVPNYKPELGMSAILKSYNGVQLCLERR